LLRPSTTVAEAAAAAYSRTQEAIAVGRSADFERMRIFAEFAHRWGAIATRGSPEVLCVFLKLGLTSFGGPADLGDFRNAFAVERRWLDKCGLPETRPD
jgi:hypothetical protein